MNDKPVLWTREEAIDLCIKLDAVLNFHGFHCGLIGSVLTKGTSTDDLDLIIFPHNTSEYMLKGAYEALQTFGMKRVLTRASIAHSWHREGSLDTKHVELWEFGRKRVDLFFMR